MFSSSPTSAQFDALSRVVSAQSEMLSAHSDLIAAVDNKLDALREYVEVIADNTEAPRADTHLLKALVASLIAEVAARSDNPYKELADILRRVKFVSSEFTINDDGFNQKVHNASELICEYAETYLRRGDRG